MGCQWFPGAVENYRCGMLPVRIPTLHLTLRQLLQVREQWQRSQRSTRSVNIHTWTRPTCLLPWQSRHEVSLARNTSSSSRTQGDASKQPRMRLIQNSASCKEFQRPSRGGTQLLFSGLWENRSPFLTLPPCFFICSLIFFVMVLFLHYNLILFKICKVICSVVSALCCLFPLFVFSVFFWLLSLFFCNSFLVSSFGLCSVSVSTLFSLCLEFIFSFPLFSFGNNEWSGKKFLCCCHAQSTNTISK